jgi:hypothetical protein
MIQLEIHDKLDKNGVETKWKHVAEASRTNGLRTLSLINSADSPPSGCKRLRFPSLFLASTPPFRLTVIGTWPPTSHMTVSEN